MATDNGLIKARELLNDARESLETANPDNDPEHPNFETLRNIREWLEHPDNQPVHLKTADYVQVNDETQNDFQTIVRLMNKFEHRRWPTKMVMLGDLEDAIEAWRRFQIAWFG